MTVEFPTRVPAIRLSRRRLLAASAVAGAVAAHRPWTTLAHPSTTGQAAPTGPWPDVAAIPTTLATDASPRFRAVADALAAAMVQHGIPGTALGILMDGQEEHAVFGVANLETNEQVTPETRFQIGSLTKTYTGTAIMRLIAEGKLDLDAPVRTYLPDFTLPDESVAARATVYHLLTHTGGWWGDAFVDTGDDEEALARYLQEQLPTLPQLAPLGMFPSYNNVGIALLGRLIEVTTDTTYRTAIRDLLLGPLALDATTLDPAEVAAGPHALGYANTPGGPVLQSPLSFPRNMDSVGNLWSTTQEQLRYARFHIADGVTPDGARLLPAETVRSMRTAHEPFIGDPAIQMGLTWWVQEVGGIRFAMHNGDTFGQHTKFIMAPERGFALVMLSNAQPGGGATEGPVFAAAAKAYLEIEAEAEVARIGSNGGMAYAPDATPLPLSAAELATYAGRFETPIDATTLRVVDDQLLLTVETRPLADQISEAVVGPLPKDLPVTVISGDRLAVGSFQVGAFGRTPGGDIGWFRISLRSAPRVGAE